MLAVYGIKSCDTCRKARAWLESQGIAHHWHDLRADGLDQAMLDRWIGRLGWEALLNKRGTTWRGLPAEQTAGLNEDKAKALMLAHPALIKRPVFERDGMVVLGFTDAQKAQLAAPTPA
ncbi:ArsC family reductase [Telmatospirillum sp. J64-1]|uniref:ArsC family reductase n=1 Tax=Telmatospirillum sp. J64-1 TaxID=2502183 RepID=UPI00115D04D6|nr:ArsC family reductase [Telmatospirillum sp. J64-1]